MNKLKTILPLFLVFGFDALGQSKIVVQVNDFENNKGIAIICLYNTAASFAGKGDPYKTILVPPANKKAAVVFEDVPVGEYAISVIHDANSNHAFDTNFLGIPTEGYGASQNKLPFAAAPKFNDNKFKIDKANIVNIDIRLRYIL